MNRKPGRPKKEVVQSGKEEKESLKAEVDVLEQSAPVPESNPEPRYLGERPEASEANRIAESRKALLQPLAADQRFFESPEGEIIVGEADKTHIWSRHMNNGKGGWVNPRR